MLARGECQSYEPQYPVKILLDYTIDSIMPPTNEVFTRLEVVMRENLDYAVCYEDQSVGRRVESHEIAPAAAAEAAKADISWAARAWFKEETYLKIGGRPVVLCFSRIP
jgi:hypothetical protein